MKTSRYGLFLAALAATLSSSYASSSKDCRCTPDDPCWPTEEQWDALNSSVDGNLVAVTPIGHPCHDPDFEGPACKSAREHNQDSVYRSSQPGAVQWPNWEDWPAQNESCHLDSARSIPCTQGRVSVYSVMAKSPKHVQKAVSFADKHNLRVAVKASGHDFAGKSSAPHSLQISTYHLKSAHFVDDFVPHGCKSDQDHSSHSCHKGSAAILGSGVQLKELYDMIGPKKLTVVAGLSHTVSAAGGYIQGGGHSPLGPWKGMASDNVLEFGVITADGKHKIANECENPDLFWALRGGGGGTFGVVVNVVVRTFPDVPVVLSSLSVNVTTDKVDPSFWHAVTEINAHAPRIGDAGASGYYFLVPTPPPGGKQATITVTFIFINETDPGAADAVLKPLVSALQDIPDAKSGAFSAPLPSTAAMFQAFLAGKADVVGGHFTFGSRLFSRRLLLSDKGPSRLSDALSRFKPLPGRTITGHIVGGGQVAANADLVDSALLPAWRRTALHLTAGMSWNANTSAEERAEIHRTVTDVEGGMFRAIDDSGDDEAMGAYLNEADPYEPDFQRSFWGKNYNKLLAVKKWWDPEALFIVRKGVGSEEWDEEGLCRKS